MIQSQFCAGLIWCLKTSVPCTHTQRNPKPLQYPNILSLSLHRLFMRGTVRALLLLSVLLHCHVLYCIILYCIVLYCIALYCIVLYCNVLYCIVLNWSVLYCIVLYYIVLSVIKFHCVVFAVTKRTIDSLFAVRDLIKEGFSLLRKEMIRSSTVPLLISVISSSSKRSFICDVQYLCVLVCVCVCVSVCVLVCVRMCVCVSVCVCMC